MTGWSVYCPPILRTQYSDNRRYSESSFEVPFALESHNRVINTRQLQCGFCSRVMAFSSAWRAAAPVIRCLATGPRCPFRRTSLGRHSISGITSPRRRCSNIGYYVDVDGGINRPTEHYSTYCVTLRTPKQEAMRKFAYNYTRLIVIRINEYEKILYNCLSDFIDFSNVTDFYHVCFISTDCIVILLCLFIFVSHCCFSITLCIAGEP